MKQYLELLDTCLNKGSKRMDRTGTGIRSIFGYQMRFNLRHGFPLVTTKKIHLKSVIYELLWFMNGNTDVTWLEERGVKIWSDWKNEDGTIGYGGYGHSWRHFNAAGTPVQITAPINDEENVSFVGMVNNEVGVDQLKNVFESLRDNPFSRRHLVVAWNPLQLENVALPPCHFAFQFYVREDGDKRYLSCQLYQRSCDVFLGLPFNIASYSLMTHMFAECLGYEVDEFVWTGGDVHLYENHVEQAKLQLSRTPKHRCVGLELNSIYEYPWDYKYEDIKITNYDPYPAIKAPIAV